MGAVVALPPGASPETYDPSPRRLEPLRRARLVVRVGDPDFIFEERMLRAAPPDVLVVSLAEVAGEIGFARGEDPHLWLAPPVLAATGYRVAEALGELEPERREEFARHAAAWAAEVERTDEEVRRILAAGGCGTFLVDHPSWGSYASHYGLRQLALEQHGKEPGPATLRRTIEAARAAGIARVIALPGARRAAVRAVARELGAEVVTIDPLAADVLDTLRRMAHLVAQSCGPAAETVP